MEYGTALLFVFFHVEHILSFGQIPIPPYWLIDNLLHLLSCRVPEAILDI